MTQSALVPEHTEKPQKAVTMSAFITLAEKARREGGNGKLILQIEVMAIYYESYYCLSHRITSLESLLSFVLRDSPCPRDPSQPSQAPSASGGDTQTPQGLLHPSSAQELADLARVSHRLQRGRWPQREEQELLRPSWYLSEPKEGKKDGASCSTSKPHHPPWRTSPSFTC